MSKNNEAVKAAWNKGYRVQPDGSVLSKLGKTRKLKTQKQDRSGNLLYYFFNVKLGCMSFPVAVHRLQAFQKFGEKIFEEGVIVRHLDGDGLNNTWDNIALGDNHDNHMDRHPAVRSYHAGLCNKGKYSKYDWRAVSIDRALGMTYKQLSRKYGMSKGTLSYHFGNGGVVGKRTYTEEEWEIIREVFPDAQPL
jgi:hypothetical protein